MPRRKVVRTVSKRQPKVQKGNEGANLAKDTKAEKLQTLLEDFDVHMDNYYKAIEHACKDSEKSIECAYMMAVANLPMQVRDMDIEEYIANGGKPIALFSSEQITKEIEISLATLKKGTRRKSTGRKKPKSAIRPQKWKKVVDGDTEAMPPPSTMRTLHKARKGNRLETPAHRGEPSQCGWDTPLITPKFDPRLPITPAMTRQPKAGEVFMSLAGSPIVADPDRSTMVLKVNPKIKKTTVVVDNQQVELEDIKINQMDNSTREHLRELKQKLNALKLSPMTT